MGGGLALWGAAAALALPATGERETVDLSFTTTRPGAPAGVSYAFTIHAPPGGEPPALRRLIVTPPAGAIVDTSVPGVCTATDEQLRTQGDTACPRDSIVGDGSAELVITGFGNQKFSQTGFNADRQQFQTVKQGDRVMGIVRGFLTEDGLDARIPTCVTGGQPPEGCPDDQARLLRSEFAVPPYVAGGRSYFTTPPECPPSGRWRSTVTLSYADGVTERVHPEQPCDAATDTSPATPQSPQSECRSRRQVVFRALARVGLRTITAALRGRRVRLDPRRPVLDLRGLPEGRYTVRVRAVTRRGTRLRFTRHYRTC